jgi:hypothetical protein
MSLLLLTLGTSCVPLSAQAQEPPPEEPAPRQFAVVVGISSYEKLPADITLHTAATDAGRVALALREEAHYDDVRLLTDAQATREGIQAVFRDELSEVVTWRDTVLFYFVGHGVGGDFDDPYLLTHDSDPADVQNTSLHVAQLGQDLQTWIPSGNFALVTDAAHGGTLDGLALLGPAAQAWPDMGSSTFQLSASATREVATEGAFAPHFIDAVTGGADTDKNGTVTASELRRYLVLAVPQATGNTQNPADAGKYDGSMPISVGVSYKETLPELAAMTPEVVYITRTVESDPEVIVIRDQAADDPYANLPDTSVDKVKFVFRGLSKTTVQCRELETLSCDPNCYVRDVKIGPCTVVGYQDNVKLSGSVFMGARGAYVCESMDNQIVCTNG